MSAIVLDRELAQLKAECDLGLYESLSLQTNKELQERASALELDGRSKAKNKDELVKLIFEWESQAFRKHDVPKYFTDTFTSEGLRKICVAYGISAPSTLAERAHMIGMYAKMHRVERKPFGTDKENRR